MRISRKSIGKLVEAINLQDYMKGFLEIKRSGNNFVARCPFHQDTSPSLYLYSDHYHCFACKAHGNIIDYEMHRTGSLFREAVESIARKMNFSLEYEETDRGKNLEEEKHAEKKRKNLAYFFSLLQKNFQKKHFLLSFVSLSAEEKEKISSHPVESLKQILSLNTLEGLQFGFTHFASLEARDRERFFSEIKEFPLFDYAGRIIENSLPESLCLPLEKENGEIEGILFFPIKNFLHNVGTKLVVDISCFDVKNAILITAREKFSFAQFLHWNNARSVATKEKNLYLTQNPFIFFLLKKYNVDNVVWNVTSKLSSYSIATIARRVKNLVLVRDLNFSSLDFFWSSLNAILETERLTIETALLPFLQKDSLAFLEGLQEEDLQQYLQHKKEILDELCQLIFNQYPENARRLQVEKKILPSIYKIKENLKRNTLLNEIAEKWFGSSPKIFSAPSIEVKEDVVKENLPEEVEPISAEAIKVSLPKDAAPLPEVEVPTKEEYLKTIFARVVTFYHNQLLSSRGGEALKYLQKRGFSQEHIKKWKLGFAPESHLLSAKASQNKDLSEDLQDIGIIKLRRDGHSFYDFFHGRILIPITALDGAPVALGGRIFDKRAEDNKAPKYLNSPESSLFSKSEILFNLHQAMPSIVTYGFVIVVEGYMDCMSLVNAGVTNVVAVLGTALTTSHIQLLSKFTKRICLCFDNDTAGRNAARRSFLTTFPVFALDAEFILIPQGKDPDDFVSQFGKEAFLELTRKGTQLLDMVCRWLWEEVGAKEYPFLKALKEEILPCILSHRESEKCLEALTFICDKYLPHVTPRELLAQSSPEKSWQKESTSAAAAASEAPSPEILSAAKRYEPWAVKTPNEIKLLFALCFCEFSHIPKRLQNVLQGVVSEESANETICVRALSDQLGERSLNVLMEMLSQLLQNPFSPLSAPSLPHGQISNDYLILLSYVRSDVRSLADFGFQELLKESLSVPISMILSEDIWNSKNSGFLRFQLKNTQLAAQRGTLRKLLADILLGVELDYLNRQLRLVSSRHFNVEVDAQFLELARERSRRLTAFDSLEKN